MRKIKLCIVDDHAIVRDGISAMLIGNTDIEIIGSLENGRDFFTFLKKAEPDVVLLDITLPDLSGIEISKLVTVTYPAIKILILTALTDENSIIESIKAGAKGFLPKDIDMKELQKAIIEVYNNKRFFGSGISETVFNGYVHGIVSKTVSKENPTLTARELDIVKLFCDGLLYKEIADRLTISIKTVESHKANIMRKLELKSTVDLVKYAIRNEIVKL